jgi:Sulfatase
MGDEHSAPSWWGRALVLVGLSALAITQPVLDLMGRNPQFFVAGGYTASQIVAFALVVVLVPSFVLVTTYLLVRVVHWRTSEVVHAVLVALLGAVFGNVVLRAFGADEVWAAVVGAVFGAAMALLLRRSRPGGLLLQYLACAQVLFLAAFLFASPAAALLSDDPDLEELGEVSVPVPPGPVVVIVLDELPLPTIVKTDGTINADRYPAFARLAATSTWFRNASSPHNHTEEAVPAIATGNVIEDGTLPTVREHPRNLLALMAKSVPVHRLEPVTDLCPRNACPRRDGQPLTRALEDSAIVYGHRVLPEELSSDLPAIDEAWGSFGPGLDEEGGPEASSEPDPLERWHETDEHDRAGEAQGDLLVEAGLAIDDTPALHFLHVVTPHVPWDATPWGTTLLGPMPPWREEPTNADSRWSALIRYQRHSLQAGAADAALGEVLDHLEATGVWDDTTLLVVADHGTGTVWPDVRREHTARNQDEVFRVPMFLKVAGQHQPQVDDAPAMTIDALPTLMDALDIRADWEMDGHSLLDGSNPTTAPLVEADLDGLFDVVRHHAADFPYGWDWTSLAAVGEHGALVGRPVAELELGPPSRLTWEPAQEASFASLPTARGEVPYVLTGTVAKPTLGEPPPLVIAVNGTIAGVTGGYEPIAGGWRFSSTVGPFYRDGANEVVAYEVTDAPAGPILRPLG